MAKDIDFRVSKAVTNRKQIFYRNKVFSITG